MDHFQYRSGRLHAEDVPLEDIAAAVGTPTYVYSRATIERHVRVLREGLSAMPHHICYAVKANANLSIISVLADLGVDFDAVSGGELARVMRVVGDGGRAIFSGVGKRDDEIRVALQSKVRFLVVESAEELAAIAEQAQALGVRAPVAIRVNPDVDAKTHPYIATGLAKDKFGVPHDEAVALYRKALGWPSIDLVAVTCHIGSQITELSPFEDSARLMAKVVEELQTLGVPLRYVGMGGGLGVPYGNEDPPSPKTYGEALASILGPSGLTLVVEPGRVIVGNAGVLLTRVVRHKRGSEGHFTLVDAGMNDLLRPALYNAHHTIVPVVQGEVSDGTTRIGGPVCETADIFGDVAYTPELGSLLALRTAGAYAMAMASTYNGRPLPAEVLVQGGSFSIVRDRLAVEELWRGERDPAGKPWTP